MILRQVLVLALTIILVFSLAGCVKAEDMAEEISDTLENAQEIILTADIKADYGDKIFTFKITCRKNAEKTEVEIKEPESVAGICAVCENGSYELQYDGTVMTTGRLTGNGLSPAEALPFLIDQWQCGYITGACAETYGGTDTVALDTGISEAISQRTWFDEKTLLPVHSEIWQNGRAVIICDFENVRIE